MEGEDVEETKSGGPESAAIKINEGQKVGA